MRIEASRLVRTEAQRATTVVALNVLLTIATAAIVGPAGSKLDAQFGMIGWAGRLPFYILLAYIGPAVLWKNSSVRAGGTVGLLLATPLALWSAATHCPPGVVVAYLVSGLVQGLVLSWICGATRSPHRAAAV